MQEEVGGLTLSTLIISRTAALACALRRASPTRSGNDVVVPHSVVPAAWHADEPPAEYPPITASTA